MAGLPVVWEFTDKDGDRVELEKLNQAHYTVKTFGLTVNGIMVEVPEEELFRLRDEIERISTS
jgi:hypothetical protein